MGDGVGGVGHLGSEGYLQLSEGNQVQLGENKTLEFTKPSQLSISALESKGEISLSYTKGVGKAQKLSLKIGRQTPLFKQIQSLSAKSTEEQSVLIKALVSKYAATLLGVHELGAEGARKVTATFNPQSECAKVLIGDNRVAGEEKKFGKKGKARTVTAHLTHLARGKTGRNEDKFQNIFEKMAIARVTEESYSNAGLGVSGTSSTEEKKSLVEAKWGAHKEIKGLINEARAKGIDYELSGDLELLDRENSLSEIATHKNRILTNLRQAIAGDESPTLDELRSSAQDAIRAAVTAVVDEDVDADELGRFIETDVREVSSAEAEDVEDKKAAVLRKVRDFVSRKKTEAARTRADAIAQDLVRIRNAAKEEIGTAVTAAVSEGIDKSELEEFIAAYVGELSSTEAGDVGLKKDAVLIKIRDFVARKKSEEAEGTSPPSKGKRKKKVTFSETSEVLGPEVDEGNITIPTKGDRSEHLPYPIGRPRRMEETDTGRKLSEVGAPLHEYYEDPLEECREAKSEALAEIEEVKRAAIDARIEGFDSDSEISELLSNLGEAETSQDVNRLKESVLARIDQKVKDKYPGVNVVRTMSSGGGLRYRFISKRVKEAPASYSREHLVEINNREYRVEVDPQQITDRLRKESEAAAFAQEAEAGKEVFEGFLDGSRSLSGGSPPPEFSSSSGEHKQDGVSPGIKGDGSLLDGVGIAEALGRRSSMEDAHIATTFTFNVGGEEKTVTLTGVFDGHGGPNASIDARQNMIQHLKERLAEHNPTELSDLGVWNALKLSLVDLSRDYGGADGSTANVSLRIDDDLWVANLGDSRSLLVGPDGKTIQTSEDAKPGDEKYQRGVENRGSAVFFKRVGGVLAVARSLGDHGLEGGVSARPKITKFSRPPGGWEGWSHVQCCDGVFDVASSKQVGRYVQQQKEAGKSSEEIASGLVKVAFAARSGDNLSAMIVPMTPVAVVPGSPQVDRPSTPTNEFKDEADAGELAGAEVNRHASPEHLVNFLEAYGIPSCRLPYRHGNNLTELSKAQIKRELAANMSGDARFKRAKSASDGSNIEAMYSPRPILRFKQGILSFMENLRTEGRLTKGMERRFEVMLNEYDSFYASSLICERLINLDHASYYYPTMDPAEAKAEYGRVLDQASAKLVSEVEEVANPESSKLRSTWLSGYQGHFVPMRSEKIPGSTNVRLCFFNLGSGLREFQNAFGSEWESEARLGERFLRNGEQCVRIADLSKEEIARFKSEGYKESVECTPEKLQELVSGDFFKRLIQVATKGKLDAYTELMRPHVPPRTFVPSSPELRTVINSLPQVIGDCTCKGQWALLNKGFSRLGLDEGLYREFKGYVQDSALREFEESSALGSSGAKLSDVVPQFALRNARNSEGRATRPSDDYARELARRKGEHGTGLTDADVRDICLRNRLHMGMKEILKETSEGQPPNNMVFILAFGENESGTRIMTNVERLFRAKEKVLIGRAILGVDGDPPDISGAACYDVTGDGSFSRLGLELSKRDGKLFVKNLGSLQCKLKRKGEADFRDLDAGDIELRPGDSLCTQGGSELFSLP